MASDSSADGPELPSALRLNIGGFGGPNYEIEWTGGSLRYAYSNRRHEEAGVEEIEPVAESWERFWSAVNALGVWGWEREYMTHGVEDGTSWSLELGRGDRRVESGGSNAYPPDAAVAHGRRPVQSADETATWKRFCAAVRELLDGRDFA